MSMTFLIISYLFSIVFFILLALLAVYKQPYWLICVLLYSFPDVLWHVPLPAISIDSPTFEMANNKDNKIVALTVDDAPSRYSQEIADILRDHDAHATFFVIGAQAQLRGGLPTLTWLVERGHELGNHGMRDEAAAALNDDTLVEQIQKVDEILVEAYAKAKIKPKAKSKAEKKAERKAEKKAAAAAAAVDASGAGAGAGAGAEAEAGTADPDNGGSKLRARDVEVAREPIPPASPIVSAPAPVPATPDILGLSSSSSSSSSSSRSKRDLQPNPQSNSNSNPRPATPQLQKRNPSPDDSLLPTPRLYRPGSALFTSRMRRTLSRLGYTLVLGSIYPFDAQLSDYKRNAAFILDRLRPGAIIVCHDRRSWTPLMLRILMPELRRRGWRVGSVGEVLAWRDGLERIGGDGDGAG